MVSTTADRFLCGPVATDFRYSDKTRLEFGEAAGASHTFLTLRLPFLIAESEA